MAEPVSSAKDLSRGDFIRALTTGIGAFIGLLVGLPSIAFLLSPALRAQAEDDSLLALGALNDYPLGTPTRFDFTRTKVNGWERTATNYGMYIIRLSESEVRIFSDIWTHLACRVSWIPELQHYVSPCHDGHFDILGANISGPPPRPLDEYEAKIEDGFLYAMLPPFRRSA